ncbi:MAG: hypothetical protein BGO25_03675 [Acidobacteriales bacterium 59-55]|nr:TonB-dependent receptor [Terriglobales bacterium]OJV40255.1 MAG: hypothetical protein BGO25_03675 [Acidobacteriales bacterium 59-55]
MKTFFLIAAIALASTVNGQQCPRSGALQGIVKDPSGALISDAVIAIESAQTQRHASTDEHGNWKLECVPYGTYSLQITAPGFRPFDQRLMIQHPETTMLTSSLVIAEVEQNLNVSASEGDGTPGESPVLDAKALEGFADDPDDLARQLQTLAASAGGAPGTATIVVDGFQGASKLPPKSAIREVRINPDMYSAEYGNPPYAGGRIEVYTKSGQDKYHGALFGALSSHIWNANDPLSVNRTPADKMRAGFELSGPLLSNKHADFALDLEHRSIDENAVVNATVLSTGGSPSLLNQVVSTPQRLWIGNACLGWQPGDKDSLTLSFAANRNGLENKGVGGAVLQEAGYGNLLEQYDLRAANTQFLSNSLLHSTRLGWSWKTTEQVPNTMGPSVAVSGFFTRGGSTQGHLETKEHDLEWDDDIYISKKQHTVKAGIQLLAAFINSSNPNTFNGAYTFAGGIAPNLTGNGAVVIDGLEQYRRALLGLAGGNATAYSLTTGNARVPLTQWTTAVYVQDDWKLNKQVNLSGGLRYFLQTSPNVPATFAPRLGIAYGFGPKQSWVLHARSGFFYSPITTSVSLETVRLNGVRQQNITVYGADFASPINNTNASQQIAQTRSFAPGVGIAPSWQSQLGLEHRFRSGWSVNANIYYSSAWDMLRSSNINSPLLPVNSSDPALGPRPYTPNLNQFEYGMTGRFQGPYAYLGLTHFAKSFNLISGYLYNGFRSNADTPNTFPQSNYTETADWARPAGATKQSAYIVFMYTLPFAISTTTNLSVASGAPYDITTGLDSNGDGVFNDRPSKVSISGSGVYNTPFGLLSVTSVNGDLPRNYGTMPATLHLDFSLGRSFTWKEGIFGGKHQQTFKIEARSANLLNHANYTGMDGIVATAQFATPVTGDYARRVEFTARMSF